MIFAMGGTVHVRCDGDDDGERCNVTQAIDARGVTVEELRALVAAAGFTDEHGYHYCAKHRTTGDAA